MKKLLILFFSMLGSFSYATNNMCIKTSDGQVKRYDVEQLVQVKVENVSSRITVSGLIDNYSYVDLGLPSETLWATYNVGATKEDELGLTYAWGETVPKSRKEAEEKNYKWYDVDDKGNVKITKYCYDSKYGLVDSLITLLLEDDAAYDNWGVNWRMPTEEEYEELIDNCIWEWVEDFKKTGVNGFMAISKHNANSLFFPYDEDSDYWSSSHPEGTTMASSYRWKKNVGTGYKNVGGNDFRVRYSPCYVRAVVNK